MCEIVVDITPNKPFDSSKPSTHPHQSQRTKRTPLPTHTHPRTLTNTQRKSSRLLFWGVKFQHLFVRLCVYRLLCWWHVNNLTIRQIHHQTQCAYNTARCVMGNKQAAIKLRVRAGANTKPNIITKVDKCWLARRFNRWHVVVTRHHVTGRHRKQLNSHTHTNKQQHIHTHPQNEISCVDFAISNRACHTYSGDMLDGTVFFMCDVCVARPVLC